MLPCGEQIHVTTQPVANTMRLYGVTACQRQPISSTNAQGDLRDPLMPGFHRLALRGSRCPADLGKDWKLQLPRLP
jgi:hypothetical protein